MLPVSKNEGVKLGWDYGEYKDEIMVCSICLRHASLPALIVSTRGIEYQVHSYIHAVISNL